MPLNSSSKPAWQLPCACGTQHCVLLCSCPPGPTVDRLMAMEPRADLLLRWNPGQTAWGHNGTCGNSINTREPSGDRLMHGNPSKTGEKTGTQGRPRGNPGQTFHPRCQLRRRVSSRRASSSCSESVDHLSVASCSCSASVAWCAESCRISVHDVSLVVRSASVASCGMAAS